MDFITAVGNARQGKDVRIVDSEGQLWKLGIIEPPIYDAKVEIPVLKKDRGYDKSSYVTYTLTCEAILSNDWYVVEEG